MSKVKYNRVKRTSSRFYSHRSFVSAGWPLKILDSRSSLCPRPAVCLITEWLIKLLNQPPSARSVGRSRGPAPQVIKTSIKQLFPGGSESGGSLPVATEILFSKKQNEKHTASDTFSHKVKPSGYRSTPSQGWGWKGHEPGPLSTYPKTRSPEQMTRPKGANG